MQVKEQQRVSGARIVLEIIRCCSTNFFEGGIYEEENNPNSFIDYSGDSNI